MRSTAIVAHTLGHQVVACFGFPRAHEDDAQRAIRVAEKVLDGCRLAAGVTARIGLHNGPAVVSGSGQIALGGTLDQASELQRSADPGQILGE